MSRLCAFRQQHDLRVLDAALSRVVEGLAGRLVIDDGRGAIGGRRRRAPALSPADRLHPEVIDRHGLRTRCLGRRRRALVEQDLPLALALAPERAPKRRRPPARPCRYFGEVGGEDDVRRDLLGPEPLQTDRRPARPLGNAAKRPEHCFGVEDPPRAPNSRNSGAKIPASDSFESPGPGSRAAPRAPGSPSVFRAARSSGASASHAGRARRCAAPEGRTKLPRPISLMPNLLARHSRRRVRRDLHRSPPPLRPRRAGPPRR